MHKEFLDSRSSILESEKRQSNLHAPSQTASLFHIHTSSLDNLPLSTKNYEGYSKEDDTSKIYIYEPTLKSLFDDHCMKKTVNVAEKLLAALQDSHQDVRKLCV